MGTHRKQVIAATVTAAVILSGCVETVSETEVREQMEAAKKEAAKDHARANMLELELKKVRSELAAGEDQRRAEIEYSQQVASITAACDAVIPVCSDAVARPGRAAQAAGYSGGGLLYLAAALGKLLGLGFFLGLGGATAVTTRSLLKARLEAPAKTKLEEAQILVKEATSRAADQLKKVDAAKAELVSLQARVSAIKAEEAEVQERMRQLPAEELTIKAAIQEGKEELLLLEKMRRALLGK